MEIDLKVAQALYLADILPGEKLPQLAQSLLEDGRDSPALRQLAGMNNPTLRDAGPLFEKILSDFGETKLDMTSAAKVLAKSLALQVVEGALSPRDAAARGAYYASAYDYPDVLTRFVADDDDYECLPRRSKAIDQDVRAYCARLIQETK